MISDLIFPPGIQTLGLPTAKVPEGTLQLPSWVDPMEQSSHTKVIQAVTFLGMVN